MNRIVHFEIVAENQERASKFYHEVFGWTTNKVDVGGDAPYCMFTTGKPEVPGIDGAMMAEDHFNQKTINTVGVESVDAAIEKIVEHGGTVVAPKMEIPHTGFVAYCKDTEGVVFGIFQSTH
jgi:predicted enzyme related to lactoylglutathione lyase